MDREVNPGPIFEHCQIDFNNSEEYDRPLPVERVAQLFERAAEVTDNPFMGLSMGQDFHYESSSLLVVAMLAAPSVGEGLSFLNAYDHYIDTAIKTSYHPTYTPAEFSADLLHEGGAHMAQLNDYLMGFLVQTLNVATRSRIPLLEVTLQHKKPRDI
ncbi:MAG: AraC family transcriptional regulator ligand-binding domain-containing protein, partial [Cellvibrionales bacterium]